MEEPQPVEPSSGSEELAAYRDWLVKVEHEASKDFDKAVMTLAAGALGISIAFVRYVAPTPVSGSTVWLGLSWTLFALSLVAILVSFLTSQFDLRRAVKEIDDGTIDADRPGEFYYFTFAMNITAAASFVLGVAFLVVFALLNVGSSPS